MASGKRQPSKHKRAAQNRAQRSALAARREAASAAAASDRTARSASSTRSPGLFGRLFGGAGGGGAAHGSRAAARANQPVGYRAALSAVLMALAGVVFCFTFSVPVDAEDEPFTRESLTATWAGSALDAAADDPSADPADVVDSIGEWAPGRGETPIAVALWPFSLTLALPVIGAALGFRSVTKRSGSRIVTRALFATLFGSLLSQIPIFFLPSVVALGVAVFQLRKYETTLGRAEVLQADGEVIEADVVDAEPVDDDLAEPERGRS